jgi:hypothetical protein
VRRPRIVGEESPAGFEPRVQVPVIPRIGLPIGRIREQREGCGSRIQAEQPQRGCLLASGRHTNREPVDLTATRRSRARRSLSQIRPNESAAPSSPPGGDAIAVHPCWAWRRKPRGKAGERLNPRLASALSSAGFHPGNCRPRKSAEAFPKTSRSAPPAALDSREAAPNAAGTAALLYACTVLPPVSGGKPIHT